MRLRSTVVGATILVLGMMLAEQAYILSGKVPEPEEAAAVYAEYVLESLGLR